MNKEQFSLLFNLKVSTNVHIKELSFKQEGTLLYGYTFDRDSFHVYIKNNLIHRYIYNRNRFDYQQKEEFEGVFLIPTKRVYPAASDYNFCELLINKGLEIPFTIWEERKEELYYGKVFPER